jgi:hypothetical protein
VGFHQWAKMVVGRPMEYFILFYFILYPIFSISKFKFEFKPLWFITTTYIFEFRGIGSGYIYLYIYYLYFHNRSIFLPLLSFFLFSNSNFNLRFNPTSYYYYPYYFYLMHIQPKTNMMHNLVLCPLLICFIWDMSVSM